MSCSLDWLRKIVVLVIVTAFCSQVGCGSGPRRISQASIDIGKVASEMMAADVDQDGYVSKEEAKPFPGFVRGFAAIDSDNDGLVNSEEIQARLPGIFTSTSALLPGVCTISLNGEPLNGAIVTFEPEAFFGGTIPKASAKVKRNGLASLSIAEEDLPAGAPKVSGLVRPGLYRVKVTHPDKKLPAKYNTKTELGVEVSPDTTRGGSFSFKLKS